MATEPKTTSARASRVNSTRWCVTIERRPRIGTATSSASSTSSMDSRESSLSGAAFTACMPCVLPASMAAVTE